MEEMNATVLEVARNAGQAAESAKTAKNKAESGADVVARVVTDISRIHRITSYNVCYTKLLRTTVSIARIRKLPKGYVSWH